MAAWPARARLFKYGTADATILAQIASSAFECATRRILGVAVGVDHRVRMVRSAQRLAEKALSGLRPAWPEEGIEGGALESTAR